jgi:hypothetical protein
MELAKLEHPIALLDLLLLILTQLAGAGAAQELLFLLQATTSCRWTW